jgi:hypothetical protein
VFEWCLHISCAHTVGDALAGRTLASVLALAYACAHGRVAPSKSASSHTWGRP